MINLFLALLDCLGTLISFSGVQLISLAAGTSAWIAESNIVTSPALLVLILSVWILSFSHFRLYHSQRTSSYFSDTVILAKGVLFGTAFLVGLKILVDTLPLSWGSLLAFAFLNFLVLASFRLCLRLLLCWLRRSGINTKNLIIVGTGPLVDQLIRKIEGHAFYGYKIRGVFEEVPNAGQSYILWLGGIDTFTGWIEKNHTDEVIIALPMRQGNKIQNIVQACENKGIHARLAVDHLTLIEPSTPIYFLDGIPLINVRIYPTERGDYLFLKRAFDLTLSFFLLVVLTPGFMLLALIVKLSSPGPMIFRQERVGLNGKKFWIYKFRTMEMASRQVSDTRWTTAQDEGLMTPLGKWLRRSGLDELPQLLNVLKGDMSMVGPRPERPHFVEIFKREIPGYMLRHYMKCGITGWAQVNGWRGDTSIQKRVEYDLYYMQHWDLWFDLKILLLTLPRRLYQRNDHYPKREPLDHERLFRKAMGTASTLGAKR